MHQHKKKSSRFTTVIVGGLAFIMLTLWYIMHSMVSVPPSHAIKPSSPNDQKLIRGSTSSISSSNPMKTKHSNSNSLQDQTLSILTSTFNSNHEKVPSLTKTDVKLLSESLGHNNHNNFTTDLFITIPDWVNHDIPMPPPPCLYSQITGYNIYLFEDGWRDVTQVIEGSSSQCPLPIGGQLPKKKDDGKGIEVSIVLAFRNMAKDTIRSIISILHCARQIDSIEILVLDIASK